MTGLSSCAAGTSTSSATARNDQKKAKVSKEKETDTSASEQSDDDDEEPLELSIDNFGRPHGVIGQLDYSFRSLPHALRIEEDERRYKELIADCETAFTAREIENTEYSTGTTFFLPATMEPRCVLEQMAKSVFDFHTKDVKEFDRSKSGAEWWTLVLDSTNQDDVSFHWDRDYGLEGSHRVNLHPHVATVTYLSDLGGPTIVLEKVGPVQTGSEECGAGDIQKGYLSRPVLGKHISFDGRLLHGAPGDLSSIFSSSACEKSEKCGKRKHRPESTQRVTFLVNVWLNHKPIESDPFPDQDLASFVSPMTSSIQFDLVKAEANVTAQEEIQPIHVENEEKDRIKSLDLTFVEAGRHMSLVLPIPVVALQEIARATPGHSSFELVFSDQSRASLIAGDEVEDESSEEEEELDEDEVESE